MNMTTKQSKITNKLEDNAKLARVGMRRRMTDSDKTLDFLKIVCRKINPENNNIGQNSSEGMNIKTNA